eukprot:TRINITY_DN45817_c0_g1_i1.p1 TRINITY_DN45817_c0_g1~~TRINITY_DN45817_c0_g1_i1.p1  ORF type:complete len:249 (+),score=46.07 TRINITY_DN45817_c0_g1_i1:169-915(+)
MDPAFARAKSYLPPFGLPSASMPLLSSLPEDVERPASSAPSRYLDDVATPTPPATPLQVTMRSSCRTPASGSASVAGNSLRSALRSSSSRGNCSVARGSLRSGAASSSDSRLSVATSLHWASATDWNRQEVKKLRSAMEDYKKIRARKARQVDPLKVVKAHPINMGSERIMVTAMQEGLERAPEMVLEPKWSSDIRSMDAKVGERHRWDNKIAGSVNGQLMPERRWMPPQKHHSSPPTPNPTWPSAKS